MLAFIEAFFIPGWRNGIKAVKELIWIRAGT